MAGATDSPKWKRNRKAKQDPKFNMTLGPVFKALLVKVLWS